MKYFFIVQGEGRGHMTQAIALSEILRSEGHSVVQVLVGKSPRREVPAFFYEKIQAPVATFESPNFVVDSNNKKIHIGKTIWANLLMAPTFLRSIAMIKQMVDETKPDVIVNFYELLGGLYALIYGKKAHIVVVGHQYLLQHPQFVFPKGYWIDKRLMSLNSWLVAARAEKKLALSFRPMPDVPRKKLFVVPPLLRSEIRKLTPQNRGYILGYLLNAGYAEEIERWHALHPEYELHFFWDKKDVPDDLKIDENLWFHRLNDVKFLEMMSKCGGYCSTAGFESICEAMYLGKPIMMVPTYGHFEQACNALDATLAGAGIQNTVFDLDPFVAYLPRHKDVSFAFRQWADSSKDRFIELLTKCD
ncbi:MAG: hypothetical protein N2662_06120 [Bacteroidales bacterium]|nr:hypothetical protein [Bacteroidales bacterium]